ncbi:gametogenetin-binding protein 2-like [Aphidius gifuensis]|uniref:gametogenetin-binding protein 2-like n=1 Tax=Aphidius gifuensis TaxID=684658 RepID=UPI001CDCD293|nr:gametogenetin-binding protein 2-like [Aphidius gifuensis]XP_044017148.1 gametogenetin-binding protein 2-like [Aphidius gifuensis]
MAKLINIFRTDKPVELTKRQLPLNVDSHLTMIMDINELEYVCESSIINCIQFDEFSKKLNILTKKELKASFEVSEKDMLEILRQTVPCVGCRRSVERLFQNLMSLKNHALDPLVITADGMITLSDKVLRSPSRLCSMLQDHSARLLTLLEKQPRNKKSRRCILHSLEVQRAGPTPSSWKEAWNLMEQPCREQLTLIKHEALETTLDNYLRKHRFCNECRTKVVLASTLLMTEPDSIKEKGYVPGLYAGIKRCISNRHVHLPADDEYIQILVDKTQSESMGRERHAKTLDVAQEEVLTCLGICVIEKLHRVLKCLREEEAMCQVFAAVAIDALARNFHMAVEVKQGITQLERLYEELEREKLVKQQRLEKLRLKRRKKKEKRQENSEEKENKCDSVEDRSEENSDCIDTQSLENNDRQKLQILTAKIKNQSKYKNIDYQKKTNLTVSQTTNLLLPPLRKNKLVEESKIDKDNNKIPINDVAKTLQDETCSCCEEFYDECPNELLKWMRVNKTRDLTSLAPSEPSSQDCGYSSEHNVSSSSMPSTPEGSEVACSEACCEREIEECQDTQLYNKFDDHSSVFSLGNDSSGPTLLQMLKLQNRHPSEDDTESYIPAEEVQEFKARMCQLHEKRLELRKNLRYRFAMLCSHYKPFGIPH